MGHRIDNLAIALLYGAALGLALGFVGRHLNYLAGGRGFLGFMLLLVLWLPTPTQAQPNHLAALQEMRQSYPTPMSKVELGDLLNRVAWEFRHEGWGLLFKAQGAHCFSPLDPPVTVACDILVHYATTNHFDVLIDAEGRAVPTWNNRGPIDLRRFVQPVEPLGDTPPISPVPPDVEPPPPLGEDLQEQLTRIEQNLVTWAMMDYEEYKVLLAIQADLKAHREAIQAAAKKAAGFLARWFEPLVMGVIGVILGVK